MAELDAATEVTLKTEFGCFSADQPPPMGAASYPHSFAASAPGTVDMRAGTRYAEISLRLERWTGQPPDAPGWEDRDELPWRTLPGERVLVVSNEFEEGNGEALQLGGLEGGRVRVSARGRHRYFYDDAVASLPPEEWLVQLWPQDGDSDPFAGPPRRIGQPWKEPLRAWEKSGWYGVLSAYAHFFSILSAVGRFPDGFTQASIAADWVATRFGDFEPMRWDDPLSPISAPTADGPPAWECRWAWVSKLAGSRGLPQLVTVGDLWTFMVGVGMISPTRSNSFTVSQPTVSAIDEPSLPADVLAEIRANQARHLELEAGYLAGDIYHMVDWSAGQTLVTSPAEIGARFNVDVELVIAALASRGLMCSVEPDPELVGVDTITTLRSAAARRSAQSAPRLGRDQ